MSDEIRRQPLTPDVADEREVIVITVAAFRDPVIGGRYAPLIEPEEFPEHTLWLNKSGMAAIVYNLGDRTERWIGKKIPLLKTRTRNPSAGGYVYKYHVAPAPSWRSYMAEALGHDDEQDDLPF